MALGGFPHPDYLYEHLTAEQLAEWQAYYQIEPWGSRKEDHRFGTLAAISQLPYMKKGAKLPTWLDIFPDSDYMKKPSRKQSMEDMKDILYSMVKDKK